MGEQRSLTLPDMVVLAILAEGPLHGYALVSELERREVADWAAVSRPHVYYSLKKLQKIGLIETVPDCSSSAGPERVIYSPTDAAQHALADALASESWATQRPPPPFLSWLALSAHSRSFDAESIVERRRQYLTAELAKERATLDAINPDSGPMVAVAVAMVALTIRQFETELAWLDAAAEAVRKQGAVQPSACR